MKKLLFALCALAAIALLTPSAGFAQWQNRIGIYTTSTAGAANIYPAPAAFSQFTIYFILTNPTRNGTPMTSVKGWEYKVTISGDPEGLVRTADTLPANIVNLGDANDPYNATYLVGMATPKAVTDNMAVLHSWTFLMINNAEPYYFYLSPLPPELATNDGELTFLDGSDTTIPGAASQDDYANPVFAVGGVTDPVGVQSETFGGVKALFR